MSTTSERIQELEEENRRLKEALAERERFIRQTMGTYVTSEVAEEILLQEGRVGIAGERRKVTMMFTDLRHSTELSERMDATDYLRLLNHYFKGMIPLIDSWRGNILGFVGDAIVVVYGAPRQNEDAAEDAVFSAVAMQRWMVKVNEWNLSQGYPTIEMGIGIHTGEAIVGTIGSDVRMKYDMIGRNVNLASRIEGYTQGGQILVSDETLADAGPLVVERPEGARWVRPKGITEKVRVHDVIGMGSLRIPRWWEKE